MTAMHEGSEVLRGMNAIDGLKVLWLEVNRIRHLCLESGINAAPALQKNILVNWAPGRGIVQ
jgi:hypothetical protein